SLCRSLLQLRKTSHPRSNRESATFSCEHNLANLIPNLLKRLATRSAMFNDPGRNQGVSAYLNRIGIAPIGNRVLREHRIEQFPIC
ncbi:MAG: hypothetical protein VW339_06205, partial [Quisquiliibacterium sp.]